MRQTATADVPQSREPVFCEADGERRQGESVSDNWKRVLAGVGGGLLGWGSAALAYRLGMTRGTHDIITYILWAIGAAMITASLLRRRSQRDRR